MSKEQAVKKGITEGKRVTINDFLDSLPENKREMMAAFLYGRTPCRLGLRDIGGEDILMPSRILSSSSRECPPRR
jgi:hypothetical protein